MNRIALQTVVSFQYRQHYLLGGAQVSGTGRVIAETVVGTEPAYVIKPDDGADCVHVRVQGVRAH
jgi:hypothetical protein